MIPFARILTYGNTVRAGKKVKQLEHNLDTLILWEDGTLWGAGYNRYGQIAGNAGNTSPVKTFSIITTGVDSIVSTFNSGFIIAKGKRYYAAGDISFSTGTNATSATLVDVTNKLYSASDGSIMVKIIVRGGVVYGITGDNKLYGFCPISGLASRGVLGTGVLTPTTSYTLLAQNVKDVYSSGNNTFYTSTDGKIYCTGWNSNSSLGINGSNQVNTWTQILPGTFSDIISVAAANNGTWIVNGTGVTFTVGSQATASGASKTTYSAVTGIPIVSATDKISLGTSSNTFNAFGLYNASSSNNNIFFSGNMTYFGAGTNTDDKGLWTTNFSTKLDYSTAIGYYGFESNIWFDGSKMYFCGAQRFIPGYPNTTGNLQFAEVQLPPGTEPN